MDMGMYTGTDIATLINRPQAVDKKMADVSRRLYEQYLFNVNNNGMRERRIVANFETIERVAEAIPLIQAIITKRSQQVLAFTRPAGDTTERGFIIKHRDGKSISDKDMRLAQEYFLNTGIVDEPDREDDLADAAQLLVRDVLTFDQVAIELRCTKNGKMADWWVLDGRSIRRLDFSTPAYEKGYRFVQLDERGKPVNIYKHSDLLFDYMNKRSGLKYRGYGFSYIEQSLDIVTTLLYGLTYNRDLFSKDKIPKGFLSVMGDVDASTLTALKQHWTNAMSGYGAKFNIPILPSGKDGVGVDFKSLGQTNRDMEYHKLLMFIVSMICAVYGIDPAELAIKTDDSQALIGESGEPRLQHSKDSGLGGLLMFIETVFNKLMRKYNEDYVFEFTGIKDDDTEKRAQGNRVKVETYMTVNEVREAEGMEKIKEPWADVVLNPQAVQLKNSMDAQAQQQGAAGGEGMDGGMGGAADTGEGDADGGDDSGSTWSADDEDVQREDADAGSDETPWQVNADDIEEEKPMKKSSGVLIEI